MPIWNNFGMGMNGMNNYNSMPYQPQPQFNNYQTPSSNYQSSQSVQQSRQNNIVWVKGKENARSMQLAPNSTVILLDSETGKFYIKTTDDIGLGKLRVFNYTEQPDLEDNTISSTPISNIDLSNYITKQELKEIIKEIKNDQSVSIAKQSKSSTNTK